MKKYFIITIVVMALASCSAPRYYYAQILKTERVDHSEKFTSTDPTLVYEDQNCAVFYQTWKENGDAGFKIYNKSDKLLHVDLTKSFFICNGFSYPYFKAREWGNSSASQSSMGYTIGDANLNYNLSNSTFPSMYTLETSSTTSYVNSHSSSISYSEMPEFAIAPKAYACVSEYNIYDKQIVSCDLVRYPDTIASMEFTEEDTPIKFGNYITYRMDGSEKEYVIQNDFYVSKVTNYAWPSLFRYVEREKKPCQNITKNPTRRYNDKYPRKVYDREFIFDNTNCFYILYEIESRETLYKETKTYYYEYYYGGYCKTSWF